MWKKYFLGILFAPIIFPETTFAHPGRTDGYGCHTRRTNCASWGLSSGEYHCHNAKKSYQPEEPIRSRFGENGTGTTTPAPDYKFKNQEKSNSSLNKNETETTLKAWRKTASQKQQMFLIIQSSNLKLAESPIQQLKLCKKSPKH